jgi:hypothetical protein
VPDRGIARAGGAGHPMAAPATLTATVPADSRRGHMDCIRPALGPDQPDRQAVTPETQAVEGQCRAPVAGANTAAKPLDNACPGWIAVECRPSTRTATDGPRRLARPCGSGGQKPRLEWAADRYAEGWLDRENLLEGVDQDIAYSADIERSGGQFDNAPEVREASLEVTHLFRREEGRWADRSPACRLLAATPGASLTSGAETVPLRARSSGQPWELAVTPGQPDTPAHLRTGRLTRCANRPVTKQPVSHSTPRSCTACVW